VQWKLFTPTDTNTCMVRVLEGVAGVGRGISAEPTRRGLAGRQTGGNSGDL
jgi:hypothetical protein